ncbi:glutaredoxin domain-containing protein [Micromonospora sp. DT81.3]|uniref:glutaredoxin domain-containing protein n=1 Tax=Micromonospora sp. DT81.3 TaxID=3416523 RepID=UPI003CF7A440
MITVYTTGFECVQCRMTKQVLTSAGLEFADINLTDPANALARDYVTDDLGYSQAPVVVVDENDHWSGFRPDLIDRLAASIGARS